MPAEAEFCAECGAPLSDAPGVGGSDAEVYPELAKANLLRMRKEFKPAEDICLAILRRFPNNASANTLLGDLAAEKGELEQAVEWYELSLDIVPDSAEVKLKLETLRQELALRQTQATVATLGIPTKKAPVGLYVMIVTLVAAFAIAGVVLANRNQTTGKDPNKTLVVNEPGPARTPSKTDPIEEEPKPVKYSEDEALSKAVAEATGIGNRVLMASVAEPGGSVRLVLHEVGADGEWMTRAKVVMEAFKQRPDAPKVEVQYLKTGDGTPEIKIVERTTYEKTLAADFDVANEALVLETLFGHKVEVPEPVNPDENKTITPPLGEPGGDTTTERPDAATGSTTGN